MNDFTEKSDSEKAALDQVGELIRQVGAREPVDPGRLQRSHARVLEHWESVLENHQEARRPKPFKAFAIAASMVMAAVLVAILWNQRGLQVSESLAFVDRVVGSVLVEGKPLADASQIVAGALISTAANGRVALRMANGQSLRVDALSQVRIDSADQVALKAGALYVDSDFAVPQASIRVRTALGVASDIGTRFQVRLRDNALIVGVVDGLVEVLQDDGLSHSVDRGYSLALAAGGGAEKRPLDESDPDWQWIESVTPVFNIEGATLEQYLSWYAHERRLELEWSDNASRINARNAGLSGSISGASLDESLELVRRIAPFRHEISGNRLMVTVE